MTNAVTFDIVGRDRASATFTKVGDKADSTADKLKKFGKTAATGVAALGGASVLAGKYFFSTSARLEQMATKAKTVFGAQLPIVENWSKKSAAAMGLTRREATGLAANFADLLIPMGFTRKAAAGMSTDVVGLSGALSQWTGGTKSAAEVSDILAKAMLGETDGLKELGISISAADVQAKLLKRGQEKLTGAAKDQAEAQAVQSLIFAKSTDAQKAFAAGGSPLLSAQARLKARLGEVRDLIAVKLIPAFTTAADWAAKQLPKAIATAKDIFAKWGPVIADVAGKVVDLAKFLGGLPGPIKSIGVEAGIAALILPRLMAAFQMTSASAMTMVGNLRNAETRTKMLGKAAGAAAGVGGLVLLQQGLTTTNNSIGFLETAAGGMLTGFAVGGPWGAAIGGAAGAAVGLARATHKSAVEMVTAADKAKHWADALNGVADASDKATRAEALKTLLTNYGAYIEQTDKLGISHRDLVGVITGEAGAYRRVHQAVKDGFRSKVQADRTAAGSTRILLDYLQGEKSELGEVLAKNRERNAALLTTKQILKSLPKRIQTEVEAEGVPASVKEIKDLTRRYHLTPKEIRTVITASGVTTTVKDVLKVHHALKETGRAKPDLGPWSRSLLADLSKADRDAYAKTGKLRDTLRIETGKARPNFDPFLAGLVSGMTTARARASSGGKGIGSSLKAGLTAGFYGAASSLASAAVAAVNAAAAAARRAADSHSPSRVFMKIGRDMGDGLTKGMAGRTPQIGEAGRDLIESLVKGIEKGGAPLQRVLDRITGYIDRMGQKVADLMGKRSDLISSFGGFTTSVFSQDFTDPETGKSTVTAASLIEAQKAERAKALRLKQDTQKLLKAGLSRDLIQQLAASGESGLAQIHALAGGTSAQVQQLNALNAQTQAALTAAGTLAGNDLYASDIKDAKNAERIAQAIAKALREEQRKHPKDEIHIHLEGREIVYSINRHQESRGKDRPFP